MFHKLLQVILQLSVCIKEARAYGAFRNFQDLRNFRMRHPLNIKHRYNCPMLVRQLEHGLVQFLLKFHQIGVVAGVAIARGFDEVGIGQDPIINIIEAHGFAAIPFFQEIDSHVHGDRVHPCVEGGFALEAVDRSIGLGEDILEKVVCILMAGRHIIDQSVEPGTEPHHQLIKSPRIPRLSAGD